MTHPLPDRITAAITALVYASQECGWDSKDLAVDAERDLLEAAISEVVAERDSWMHSANVVANEAQQLRAERDAAQAKMAELLDAARYVLPTIENPDDQHMFHLCRVVERIVSAEQGGAP